MIPLLLPLNRFLHWNSGIMEDTDNLLKGVIESVLISKGIVKVRNLLLNPRGYFVTTMISVLRQPWSSSLYPRVDKGILVSRAGNIVSLVRSTLTVDCHI